MNNLVKQLSETMGVSESDVLAHATLIANEIKRDKVESFFIESDESVGVDMIKAYSEEAVKTSDRITTAYLTNSEFKQWTQDAVIANIYGA